MLTNDRQRRAGEEQHVVAGGIGAAAQLDGRPVQVGDHAGQQVHDGASGPIVHQLVGGERGQGGDVGLAGHGFRGGLGGTARVDPAVEGHDQRRFVQLGMDVYLDQLAHVVCSSAL